jgi:hypothetical protein
MNALARAKVRSFRRRHEGGAALFIVAMILAVLASVGLYALAAASSEIRTSGNERQSTQTHYLAEYGILSAANYIQGKPDLFDGLTAIAPDWPCVSLPGVPQTADILLRSCWRIEQADLASTFSSASTMPYAGLTPYSANPPGSLGPSPIVADFFVELTSPTQKTAPARYALGLHFCFHEYTATAVGITRPLYAQQTQAAQAGAYIAEGEEMQRARFIVGPTTDCQ